MPSTSSSPYHPDSSGRFLSRLWRLITGRTTPDKAGEAAADAELDRRKDR